MRRLLLLLAALHVAPAVLAGTTAVVNVNVIPMTSEIVLRAQTVVIQDGIIMVIGDVDLVPVPEAAELIDGTDRYLMPGLTEMHAHVTGTGKAQITRLFSLFLANGKRRATMDA